MTKSFKIFLFSLTVVGILAFCKSFCLVLAILGQAKFLDSYSYSWGWIPAMVFLVFFRVPKVMELWENLMKKLDF